MDELREQFLIESRDLIADAGQYFAALARNPQVTASIEGAFRAVHTLKGSVALFALQPAEQLLHAAEDLLERARKGSSALDAGAIAALVDCLDLVDRWIDAFERSGALPDDAAAQARRCVIALGIADTATLEREAKADPAAAGGWLDRLRSRDAAVLAAAGQPLIAFCYQPDADCFFRGDDPLATVREVPDLATLAIVPRDGAWPDAGAIEPFVCFSRLEGLSAAPLDAVRTAFRMMPDQVVFATIEPPRETTERTSGDSTGKWTLRVDPQRIDALGDTVGELLVAIHGFAALADDVERIDRALAARLRAGQANLERVTGEIGLGLGAVRQVPIEQGLRRLPRLVREIAESLGKAVDFSITGQDLEIDRQLVEGLFEPLMHLLRNAIDHGIETPHARLAAGKPPVGILTLAFQRDRDLIIATLTDDGQGLDPDKLRRTAQQRGLLGAQALATLSDAAALRLVFLPGFSTATMVTELSGRGVGMDAVQAAVAKLRGSVEIASAIGQGATFRLTLPARTLTTQLLVIEAGGDRYGVAIDQIVETVALAGLDQVPIGTGTACVLHDRTVPVLDLAGLLGSAATAGAPRESKLIVVQAAGEPVALRVDAIGERIDALVRPAGGMLALIRGVTGSALLGDGAVLLVLDLPGLAS